MAYRLSSDLPSDSTLPRLSDDCDPFDFMEKDCYSPASAVRMSYEKAVQKLSSAGPIFVDTEGRRVWFDGLDWDVQCRMINTMTRQIEDKEEYILNMPKGNWLNYEPGLSVKLRAVAHSVSKCDAPENVEIRSTSNTEVPVSEVGLEASPVTKVTSPNMLPGPSSTEDQRKDSAHSVEQTQIPHSDKEPLITRTSKDSKLQRRRPHRYNPHDVITFVDEFRNTARRTILGMEDSWHPSKLRVLPTLAELKPDEILVESPKLRKIGSARSVLYEGTTLLQQ